MIAHPLRHWLAVIAPTLDCPTDPRGVRVFDCPGCKINLGLHFGRRGQLWFIAHPPWSGGQWCRWQAQTWRSTDKDDCIRFFHEETNL